MSSLSNPLSIITLAYWNILRFRLGPEDLPDSTVLTALSIAAYAATSLLTGLAVFPPFAGAIAAALDTMMMVVLGLGLLQLRNLYTRANQTLAALAGSGTLLNLATLPLIGWSQFEIVKTGLPDLLQLFLVVWNFAVITHILRRALSVPTGVAAIITLIWSSILLTAFYTFVPTSS